MPHVDLGALVRRLNSHRVGGIGGGLAAASAATLLGQGLARGFVASTIAPLVGPDAAHSIYAVIDAAVQGASATLVPAIAAAYAGRPAGV